MDEIRLFVENFLNDEVTEAEVTEFAIELPERLIMEESHLEEESPQANAILQKELPDICESWEPGNSIEDFKARIKDACSRAVLEY